MKKNSVLFILLFIPFFLMSQNNEIEKCVNRFQYNKALELCKANFGNSDNYNSLIKFAQIYNKLNLPDSALIYLNKISIDDQDYQYFAETAISYSLKGNDAEVNNAFTKLFSFCLKAKNFAVIAKGIEVFSQKKINKIPSAQELIERTKEAESSNPKFFIANAGFLYNTNMLGEAVTEFNRAIYYDSLNPYPHYMIGKIYYQNRSYLLSIESLNKAKNMDPLYYPAYKELGNLYYDLGKNVKALENFKFYCDSNTITLNDSLKLASMFLLNKQFTDAEAINNSIINSNPNNVYSLRLNSYINCENDKNIPDALTSIEKMFTLLDSNQVITSDYEYRGRLYSKSKKDSIAIINYNIALNRDSTHIINYEYIAKAYENLKNTVQAATYYQKSIEHKERPLPSDYYYMGRNFYISSNIPIDSITKLNPEKRIADSLQKAQYLIKADTAFGTVITLSPNSHLGFLWKARSQRVLDPETSLGLALPFYTKTLAVIESKPDADKAKYKKEIIESYTYLAFYYYLQSESFKKQNNKEKSEEMKIESLKNWQKVLDVDPNDATALDAIKKMNK